MIIFSERLDSLLISNGFVHSGTQIGKGHTFDLPIGENYERRLRIYYEGPGAYLWHQNKTTITLFCMDRPLSKKYKDEFEITDEEIKAFIQLSK
jgi:hypothetical protein